MLVQEKPQNITTSVQRRLVNGQTKKKLSTQKQAVGIGDTKYLEKLLQKQKAISMQEFLQENKKEICKDKVISSKRNIQITKLSKTLAADLTSKDKAFEEYWNSYSKKISEKLSFHQQIDFQDLVQENSSVGFLRDSEENLQFLKTKSFQVLMKPLQKICLKLSQSSLPDITGGVATKQVTRKVRIYPNLEQKKLFKKLFDGHRYFYNKTVEQMRENDKIEDKDERNKANTFGALRSTVVINNSKLSKKDNNLWMKDIPHDTRQLAVKTAITARKAAFTNLRNKNITHFKMNFISKKYSDNVFYVKKAALIKGRIFKQILKNRSELKSLRDYETIEQSDGSFPIKQEKDGRYYICIVIRTVDTILVPEQNICALDPGVRTFQTMFSEDSVGEFGFDTSNKLYNLYRREDRLKSIITTKKLRSKNKYKFKKRCALLRTKIKNVVQDLHWKTADYLTKKFQVILLPTFGSKKMANKKTRKISKVTTRLLLGLSHYDFQQKLLYKAKQRGRNVILCNEHLTTKCCGQCGTLNEKIGSKKIFHCEKCNLVMDRDIHAARNILIRSLTLNRIASRT